MSTAAAAPTPQLISEPITPARLSMDLRAMARREPGLPDRFTWRRREYVIHEVLERWKTLDRPGPGAYVRRHWCRLRMVSGEVMTVYCERHTSNPRRPKACWWLYSLVPYGRCGTTDGHR